MQLIRDVVDEYPFLAMDTEFPGVVARPVGNFKNSGEYHYQTLRRVVRQQRCGAVWSAAAQPAAPRRGSTGGFVVGRVQAAGERSLLISFRHMPRLSSCRRLNVDMLKLIQLGLTFTDAQGNLPRINGELCVWQFNFRRVRAGARDGTRSALPREASPQLVA